MPLKSPVSALASQTIRAAYEELERTITPAESREFRSKSLQEIRKAALDIERELGARQCLRNMRRLAPLFNGLEHYAKAIDVLCNGTPYLPWLWAPITLILRIASEYVEAFEIIIKAYSRIAESLSRFEILGTAFATDHGFQQILAVYYADILEFHKHAYKFVRRSGWRLLFLTSWGRFQRRFDIILEDLQRHEALVDTGANARDISEAQKMRQDVRTWREESLEQVARAEQEQASKQYQAIMAWLKMDDSEQLAIFDTISAEGTKYPGTCGWALTNPKIKSWLQRKPETPMLWLQGPPGSGKSVLSAQLVSFIMSAKEFVLYHFCTYSYSSSTTYDQILRSLLLQLLRKDGDLVAHVYEECVLGRKPLNVAALEQLLQKLFSRISNDPAKVEYVWIILDGVDECESDKQARITSLLSQISLKSSTGGVVCKTLISSRASSMLSKRLSKKQTLGLTEEKNCLEQAIRRYAFLRLQGLSEKLSQLHVGPIEMNEIESKVVSKADGSLRSISLSSLANFLGMFLYARLVLDYVATNIFYSSDEIMSSVEQLPEKLMDFYHKILTQVLIHLDARSVDRVKCIFGWVAFSKRPLRKLEFLSAISFSSRDPKITKLVPQYVFGICSPFVEERRDGTIAFIHVSVKDFLQTPLCTISISEQKAIEQHGLASLTCLLSGVEVLCKNYDEHTKCLRVIHGLHGLHIYATEYWIEYLLSYTMSASHTDEKTPMIALSHQLSSRINEAFPATSNEFGKTQSIPDERLSCLQRYESLYKLVETTLKARSVKRLESELTENVQSGPPLLSLDSISAMRMSYQNTVRFLLCQSSYPSVSTEELELFKNEFRTSAYTCRLTTCPWATLGFETETLLLEHELTHVRRFRCTWTGCQYPPLPSAKSLKNHVEKYHCSSHPRKSIRTKTEVLASAASNPLDNTGELNFAKTMVRGYDWDDSQRLPTGIRANVLRPEGLNWRNIGSGTCICNINDHKDIAVVNENIAIPPIFSFKVSQDHVFEKLTGDPTILVTERHGTQTGLSFMNFEDFTSIWDFIIRNLRKNLGDEANGTLYKEQTQ